MAAAAAPCHAASVSPDVTDPNELAAVPSSPANPSQAAAADSIGPAPAPRWISAELTSGGNTKKFMTPRLSLLKRVKDATRVGPRTSVGKRISPGEGVVDPRGRGVLGHC